MDFSEIKYNAEINLPRKKYLFRLISILPLLLVFKVFRRFIYKKMYNLKRCRVTPGFSAIVGVNIYAQDAYLGDTKFLDYAPILIGSGTIFSGGNTLITSTHDFNDFMTVKAKPIIIGSNVWITHQCIILGGVKIGDNSVIGAGSVVTRDIPSNVFAAGNPCKVVKKINRSLLNRKIPE